MVFGTTRKFLFWNGHTQSTHKSLGEHLIFRYVLWECRAFCPLLSFRRTSFRPGEILINGVPLSLLHVKAGETCARPRNEKCLGARSCLLVGAGDCTSHGHNLQKPWFYVSYVGYFTRLASHLRSARSPLKGAVQPT